MKRSRLVRTVVPLAAVVVAAGAGAWALRPAGATSAGAGSGGGSGPLRLGGDHVATAAYRTFDTCPALLDHLRSQARPLVGAYGVEGVGVTPVMAERMSSAASAASEGRAPAAAPADAGAVSGTGTNVQVAGVDEADVTKRSGDLVLTVAGDRNGLTVLRTSGSTAKVVGRLATDFHPDELLVNGSTVLLLGSAGSPQVRPDASTPKRVTSEVAPAPTLTPSTRIVEVSLADPAHPRLVRTLTLDGTSAGARLSGGVLRLALSAQPSRLPFVQPRPTANDPSGTRALKQAQTRNRAVVDGSTIEQWLPHYTLTPAGGASTSGTVVDCSRVGVPGQFSGLGTLALLTFDLGTRGLARWDAAGVVASGAVLYATSDHAYVATTAWQGGVGPLRPAEADAATSVVVPPGRAAHTQIHEFATDGRVRYLGSGNVEGSLLDQYALDEYQGRLRVATTTGASGPIAYPMQAQQGGSGSSVGSGDAVPVPPTTRITPSSTAVTVLQLRDGALRQVGRVDGLGRGETIKAVRFAGPVGYVVTFRQTDPLFTLDLADPAHPAVAGELTMPGYSAYLHPLGGDLLLGVGRAGSADGQTDAVLVSLFDVADPAHPRLLDRVTVPNAWSGVENDAHAFAYAAGLAMVPVENGVLAVPVSDRGLGTPSLLGLGSGAGDGLDPSRARTFADGDLLWTLAPTSSGAVLAAHDTGDLALLSSLRF